MGFWSSVGSAISSTCSSMNSESHAEKEKNDLTYQKYAKDIGGFKIDPKVQKKSLGVNKMNFDELKSDINQIESLDDVKKHFDNK